MTKKIKITALVTYLMTLNLLIIKSKIIIFIIIYEYR